MLAAGGGQIVAGIKDDSNSRRGNINERREHGGKEEGVVKWRSRCNKRERSSTRSCLGDSGHLRASSHVEVVGMLRLSLFA